MKLSIITINLNNKFGLERTINSVIEQNYSDYEYIIIDGASTDGSLDLIKQFSQHISYWISETDRGVYNAMNKGICRSTGDYCYFLNSGDILYNENVLEQIISKPIKEDIVCFDAIVTEGNRKSLVKAPQDISFYVFYNHTILHQATLIKRSLFEKFGLYNEKFKIVSDWEFFIKAIILGNCSYQSVQSTISVFDSTGMSSDLQNIEICISERQRVLNNYLPYFIPDYSLIQSKSIYIFLRNLNKFRLLRHTFLFLFRVINKVISIFN